MKRDLIDIQDLSRGEINGILDLTVTLKDKKSESNDQLKGKAIALIFQKPSNRTRVSFEVGIWQLGGKCFYLGPDEISLGKRESTSDAAKTLSRYLDGIVARTHSHQDIIDLAKFTSIPVINGLSDVSHPCQALTDIFTIKERFGQFKGVKVAYVGDGNNVCYSLLEACAKVGLNMSIATPKKYGLPASVVKITKKFAAESGAKIEINNLPHEAVKDAHVVYTDTWVSMGQEAEAKKRFKDFKGFQVDSRLVAKADKNYIFMHCLPAHRGQEVTADVIDGKHSVVFDQAENRMHVQKPILIFLLGEKK